MKASSSHFEPVECAETGLRKGSSRSRRDIITKISMNGILLLVSFTGAARREQKLEYVKGDRNQ